MEKNRKIKGSPYLYSGSCALAATAGVIGNMVFTVDAGKNYHCTALLYKLLVTTSDNEALVSFMLMGNDAKLFNDFIPSDVFGGNVYYVTGGVPKLKNVTCQARPVYFDKAYTFGPKSNIKVEVRNEYALAMTAYVMLLGYNSQA